MKTITSFVCVAFALLLQAQAVVPAPDGVLLDDNPSLALQNDADSTSPELAGVETQTVLGLYNSSTLETRLWYMDNNVHVGTVAGPHAPAGWSPPTPWLLQTSMATATSMFCCSIRLHARHG